MEGMGYTMRQPSAERNPATGLHGHAARFARVLQRIRGFGDFEIFLLGIDEHTGLAAQTSNVLVATDRSTCGAA